MKLATLINGTRDGQLVLVSRNLSTYVDVSTIAPTMQVLLDNWDVLAPKLKQISVDAGKGTASKTQAFDPKRAMAPLPRAFQWCDGSAYLSHAELVRKARNAEMPEFLYQDPLMYQGGSDTLIGARDDIQVADESWGIDLEAEVAVITGDVPMGVSVAEAGAYIRLVTVVNDVSLRNIIPHELSKGFGFFHSKPSTAFACVAVTPDELAPYWDGAKLNLPVVSHVNGVELGHPHAGTDLNFDFPQLIAHAARTRRLAAGTIIGSGTVSNRDPAVGSSCLAERRMLEIIDHGKASTEFLKFGDEVQIDVTEPNGESIFGAIRQKVVKYSPQTR